MIISLIFQIALVSIKIMYFKVMWANTYALYYISSLCGIMLIFTTIIQFVAIEDNNAVIDRCWIRILRIDPREVNRDPYRDASLGSFFWPVSDLDRGQIIPLPA